jgi:multidrug resistance efflux pump
MSDDALEARQGGQAGRRTVRPARLDRIDDVLAAISEDRGAWDDRAGISGIWSAVDDPAESLGPDPSLDDIFSLPPPSRPGPSGPSDMDDIDFDDVISAFSEDEVAETAPRFAPPDDRAGPTAFDPLRQPPARAQLPQRAVPRNGGMHDLDRVLNIGTARRPRRSRWRVALVWAALLGVLAFVAFLPYRFAVGGDFTVQPFERAEARSRTDGEITEIRVAEGDWVQAGTIMAVLSNWDEQRDVDMNEADDAKLRADLATLQQGAKPEEIEAARQAVATAEVQVAAARDELNRQETLFASDTISQAAVEQARSAHALAVSNRDEAVAQLALVAAPARDSEIASLQAAIQRNQDELGYSRLMLENTYVRAPSSGQVVGSLEEVPVGTYLTTGSLFAELEDNRTVVADIEVPEITIEEVKIGAKAELRLWSDPETSLHGVVRSVSPRAEERDFGNVVRVQVEVPNADNRLAANMTGFGKIEAAERPVWEAFSRAVQRFFIIEVWSWVP